MHASDTGGPTHWVDSLEETIIAILLGAMTLITFVNVVARYVLNSNILWALETTVFLFAWLVLIGVSYCVKKNLHLGVDVVVNTLPQPWKKFAALAAVGCCLAFSVLLLIGSWDYWYPFATKRVWMETEDVPMPAVLMFLADLMNDGEKWEKMPRFIPYFALPLGMALMLFRYLQVAWKIIKGETDLIIASHEAEDMDDLVHPAQAKDGGN
ncbi:MAG: TRAP transporter small permease [Rhodospirillales bacterium]